MCNVLALFSLSEVEENLKLCNSITLSLDASNRKSEKLEASRPSPVLFTSGIHTKVIEFTSLPGETSELQSNILK